MKRFFTTSLILWAFSSIFAQIGYQVALLNTATGEPRALETVKVDIAITNSVGNSIYQGSQSSTTNEFGILSLSVGNSETFQNVDWSKLPLYISATVDDVLIGKTQILSVPVAEHAKHYGTLTKEMLRGKTWKWEGDSYCPLMTLSFTDSSVTSIEYYMSDGGLKIYREETCNYFIIDGNKLVTVNDINGCGIYTFIPDKMFLIGEYLYK